MKIIIYAVVIFAMVAYGVCNILQAPKLQVGDKAAIRTDGFVALSPEMYFKFAQNKANGFEAVEKHEAELIQHGERITVLEIKNDMVVAEFENNFLKGKKAYISIDQVNKIDK